jgi:ribulose 1,5-bisphosphate synthetase/thiazole synthase
MIARGVLVALLAITVHQKIIVSALPASIASTGSARKPTRIAVIGAGAAGSSAAFWISKGKERNGLNIEVDIYDKNNYIGGRMSHSFSSRSSLMPGQQEAPSCIHTMMNRYLPSN